MRNSHRQPLLVGNVSDVSSAVISGASITAKNADTHEVYTTTSNTSGHYEINFIKVGTYTIEARQPGFQTIDKTGVIVEADQTVRTDFTMQIGRASETLTVASTAPPVVTDRTDHPRNAESNHEAEDLPLNGRDSLKLAVTTPGVLSGFKTPSTLPGGGEDFIGPGTREVQNSISLDGVSIMTNLINTSSIRPSVDAVWESRYKPAPTPRITAGTWASRST